MAQNDDPRGPSHKSNVDSVEVVAEASADGAYEIRLTKASTGAHASHRAESVSPAGGTQSTGPHAGAPAAVGTKKNLVPAVVVGTMLLGAGGFVAYSSLDGASPPAPSRVAPDEAPMGASDDGDAGARRRTVTPIEGFRVYQGEGGRAVSSTVRPVVNLDLDRLRERDAGGSEDTAVPEEEVDEAIQPEPSEDDELPPEVIQRMREVPVFVPEEVPALPEAVELAPRMGVRSATTVPREVRLPSLDDEMMDEDEADDSDDQRY